MSDIHEPSIEAMRSAPVKFRYGSNRRLILVDAFTASAVLAVWTAANPDNRAKLDRMVKTPAGLSRVAAFAFSHV